LEQTFEYFVDTTFQIFFLQKLPR